MEPSRNFIKDNLLALVEEGKLSLEDASRVLPELKRQRDDINAGLDKAVLILSSCVGKVKGFVSADGIKLHKHALAALRTALVERMNLSRVYANWTDEDWDHIRSLMARLDGVANDGPAFTVSEDQDWLAGLPAKLFFQPEGRIRWTGDNLKEVIAFTGRSPRFNEWFSSWDEFEQYVHDHDDILKLFSKNGDYFEVPKGAWILKTPEGYFVPSVGRFVAAEEWTDDDESMLTWVCGIIHSARVWKQITLKEESDIGKWMDKWLNHRPSSSVRLSEEDRQMFDCILDILCRDGVSEQNKSAIDRLKIFREKVNRVSLKGNNLNTK